MQQHESFFGLKSEAKIVLNLKSSCCNQVPLEPKDRVKTICKTPQFRRKTADAINSVLLLSTQTFSLFESIKALEFTCTPHSSTSAPEALHSITDEMCFYLSFMKEISLRRRMDGLRVLRYNIYNISAFISLPNFLPVASHFPHTPSDSKENIFADTENMLTAQKICFTGSQMVLTFWRCALQRSRIKVMSFHWIWKVSFGNVPKFLARQILMRNWILDCERHPWISTRYYITLWYFKSRVDGKTRTFS